jgi:phthiocerol/phenolphthiocerol synthesis type-I polyketide synthase D
VRNPVRLSQAITTAGQNHTTFIEISPHPMLTHPITDTLESTKPTQRVLVTSAMNRAEDQTLFFHSQLAAVGVRAPASSGPCLADIPTTPWQRSTFWVADRSATWASANTHPLLGAHTEMPSGDHVWQADVGTEVFPWLADCKVHGQAIMPAAGFIEIALAATTEALGLPVHAVSVNQFTIEQMLPLESHTRITTQLIRRPHNTIRVEVHSRSANGDWCRHAVAQVDTSSDGVVPDERGRPLESLGTAVSPADFYAGQNYGPAFAALTRIVLLPRGIAESEITVPDEAPRYPGCRIHPVMLDAALQSLAAVMPDSAVTEPDKGTYVPVSFETIRVFTDVGRHARCRAELVGPDGGGAGTLSTITLTDDAGKPTSQITGVRVRRVERATIPLPLGQKLFETAWTETPSPVETAASTSATTPGSWLVLRDDTDARTTADEFAARWRSSTRRVITADLADESAVLAAFAEAAAHPDRPPIGVVAFIGYDSLETTDPGGALDRARDSIWSLSAAVRAVVGGWHARSPRLWLLTRRGLVVGDGESGDPAIGTLRGLIRVLAYEHPELGATLVDLDTDADAVSAMTAELASSGSDDVIAWRGPRRFVERLSRAGLGARKADPVVRHDGSYIVTGGLGGLGLVVARWLVDKGAGRVVLNGRSRPSDEHLKIIAELQSRCEIVTVQGDITTPEMAERLVAAAGATNLQLRGILHLAAVIDDSLLVAMSRESLERVWAPKAAGALRLHEATAGRALDWWLGFSSTASLLGSPGQTAYACANAWLDALVSWRKAAGLPAAAINWGLWSDVGVARSLTNSAVDPITPAEGIEALGCLLGSDRVHTGFVRLRPDRALAAFPEIRGLGYFTDVVGELNVAGDDGGWEGPEGLRELDPIDVERVVTDRLCSRVAAVMGHADQSAIDRAVPLIEVGVDSLMAVRIRNTARVDFGVEPPVALLLQGASVQDVAADLIRQLGLGRLATTERSDGVRDRAHQRAAARHGAALRRKRGQRL